MAPPFILEIVRIDLNETAKGVQDPVTDTKSGRTLGQEMDWLRSDVEGVQFVRWGARVEDPGKMQLYILWSSPETHPAFTRTPDFGPFAARLFSLCVKDTTPLVFHVAFAARSPQPALSAPATEIFAATWPTTTSESARDEYSAAVEKFFVQTAPAAEGLMVPVESEGEDGLAYAHGWSMEHEVQYDAAANKKGRVFVGLIGWKGVPAHMKFRESKEFKESVGLLRAKEAGLEMYHVDQSGE